MKRTFAQWVELLGEEEIAKRLNSNAYLPDGKKNVAGCPFNEEVVVPAAALKKAFEVIGDLISVRS